MRFALPFTVIACFSLVGCGGLTGQGTIGNSNAVVVLELPTANPVVMSITHSGQTLNLATDACTTTNTTWCTRTDAGTQREITFELDRNITPYTIWLENPSGTDQTGVVKIYIDGTLRFNKSKTIPAGQTINAAEMS